MSTRLVFGSPEANELVRNERAFAAQLVADLWQLYPWYALEDGTEPPLEADDFFALPRADQDAWARLRDEHADELAALTLDHEQVTRHERDAVPGAEWRNA